MTTSTMLGIGKASEKSGCNIETIRYYERIGLLPNPGRSAGGHRMYNAEQVQQLIFIKRARELGFSLQEIKALLALSQTEREGCVTAQSITNDHLAAVRKKITDLQELERVLASLSQRCLESEGGQCPVLMSLSTRA